MVRFKRTAFTLVELLVVITIIGMLMAILLPAVGAATESARAAQCKNRVKNIALAMANYESRNSGFSGYIDGAEDREGNTVPFSWLVAVMPDLERQDIYDRWTDPLPQKSTRNHQRAAVSRFSSLPQRSAAAKSGSHLIRGQCGLRRRRRAWLRRFAHRAPAAQQKDP